MKKKKIEQYNYKLMSRHKSSMRLKQNLRRRKNYSILMLNCNFLGYKIRRSVYVVQNLYFRDRFKI